MSSRQEGKTNRVPERRGSVQKMPPKTCEQCQLRCLTMRMSQWSTHHEQDADETGRGEEIGEEDDRKPSENGAAK